MRIERIVKMYNDLGKELFVGDAVEVTTAVGTYKGNIKRIQSKAFAIEGLKTSVGNHKAGGSILIQYKDVHSIA